MSMEVTRRCSLCLNFSVMDQNQSRDWFRWVFKIHKGEMLGCLDMRSSGYFHVSRDTLQQIMKSSFKDNCSFLSEDETSEYFDLYNKDNKETISKVKSIKD